MSTPTRRRLARKRPVLPPPAETQQQLPARLALTEADVHILASRVVSGPSPAGEPGQVRTMVFLVPGASGAVVAGALRGLPGVVGVHVGELAVAVYRSAL